MVNARSLPTRAALALAVLAVVVLVLAARLRSAEYDEQYTLFVTSAEARPGWDSDPISTATVLAAQAVVPDLGAIATALRRTDVHPPLYFWLAALWRAVVGEGLFALRLLSVACSLASLVLVARLAREHGVAPGPAVLLTLGCYGFVHTGIVARGFALALLLLLLGAVLLTGAERWRAGLAGFALGTACATNYLAVFPAAGLLLRRPASPAHAAAAVLGMAPGLALAGWFFLAQRGARPDQFPPFDPFEAARLLARAVAGATLGGLPLYLSGPAAGALAAALSALGLTLAAVALRWAWQARPRRYGLLAAAAAPPAGLILLGLAFNNTPIEQRYLAFALPFAMILLAGGIGTLSPIWGRALLGFVLLVQSAALTGLMLAQTTMQPARQLARGAADLAVEGSVILLPHGNDGVGIVGAFAVEAPRPLSLLVVRAADQADALQARLAGLGSVVLVAMAQDDAARRAIATLRTVLAHGPWQRVAGDDEVGRHERAP